MRYEYPDIIRNCHSDFPKSQNPVTHLKFKCHDFEVIFIIVKKQRKSKAILTKKLMNDSYSMMWVIWG